MPAHRAPEVRPRPQPAVRVGSHPAPAAPSAPAAVDPSTLPEREQRRRNDVCQISTSLCASLRVWYNQPPGRCEALDTTKHREAQRCPAPVTHAVRFHRDVTAADAYTCAQHAAPLAATADGSPYITAEIHRLR
ncbi:hypothetical protein [Streptomyces sp. SHP 1-2]|uniref:hypothetical protein n=1 Tax=Streptomyces sp. SHP 1-2 TaxID=2769489 RepID=UPI0022380677|nr:hypothetical protein [Streptomyces sp. SHP 1-2]MCW5254724.1 hypothetical protein [Streptomyces sp. SHP 1-2]